MIYGCRPDEPNPKDWIQTVSGTPKLYDYVDHSRRDSPIQDQIFDGPCVADAVVSAYEYLWGTLDEPHRDLSRLFLYHEARKFSGNPTTHGTTIRAALDAAGRAGICLESTYPYD